MWSFYESNNLDVFLCPYILKSGVLKIGNENKLAMSIFSRKFLLFWSNRLPLLKRLTKLLSSHERHLNSYVVHDIHQLLNKYV